MSVSVRHQPCPAARRPRAAPPAAHRLTVPRPAVFRRLYRLCDNRHLLPDAAFGGGRLPGEGGVLVLLRRRHRVYGRVVHVPHGRLPFEAGAATLLKVSGCRAREAGLRGGVDSLPAALWNVLRAGGLVVVVESLYVV